MVRVNFVECQAQSDVDPARSQNPLRAGSQLLTDLGHHLFGKVEQQELHRGRVEIHLLGGGVGQCAKLQDEFGAGIRRADHDDGARAPAPTRRRLPSRTTPIAPERDRADRAPRRSTSNPLHTAPIQEYRTAGSPNRESTPTGPRTARGCVARDRCKCSRWSSRSTRSTRPRIARTPSSVPASGMATNRASTTPPATSGSSGV